MPIAVLMRDVAAFRIRNFTAIRIYVPGIAGARSAAVPEPGCQRFPKSGSLGTPAGDGLLARVPIFARSLGGFGGRTWARTKDPLIKSHDQRVLARPHVSKNGGILGFRVRIVLEMFASIHYKKLPKVAGTYGEQSRFDGR